MTSFDSINPGDPIKLADGTFAIIVRLDDLEKEVGVRRAKEEVIRWIPIANIETHGNGALVERQR